MSEVRGFKGRGWGRADLGNVEVAGEEAPVDVGAVADVGVVAVGGG